MYSNWEEIQRVLCWNVPLRMEQNPFIPLLYDKCRSNDVHVLLILKKKEWMERNMQVFPNEVLNNLIVKNNHVAILIKSINESNFLFDLRQTFDETRINVGLLSAEITLTWLIPPNNFFQISS